ncbi:MAG TPA: PKD domain-containing protein, partial [Thermoplasmatales archaeon]|nr:PKD domain-containing protein [Thermoplasmatales archaeon]
NVLLVGSVDKFPVRYTYINVQGSGYTPGADLYYADIYDEDGNFQTWDTNSTSKFGEYDWNGEPDELDGYPDVAIGRLACVDTNEVTTVVNKIINYENNEAYKQEWFTNLVVVGGDTAPNDPDDVDEGEYVNQKVIDVMDGFNPTELWASNGKVASASYINDAINSGAGFVDFSGHGSPNSWATHPHNNEHIWLPAPTGYTSTHASSLANGDKLPVIIMSACSTGDYTSSKHCLAWSFIANSNGGGIAIFSPDEISYGYIGRSVIYGLDGKMELSLFKAYKLKGAITFGEMWTRALNLYISGRMYSADYLTIEEWQPFGDPTLAIAEESNPPEKPTITGPTQGKPGEEYTFEAQTTDPDGDKIYYMFDWGDGRYSNWLGPYNSGTKVEATHTWNKKDTYEVKVKAKDDHGVVSEWSDPLPVSMPISKNTPEHPTIIQILLKILNLFKINWM